MGRGIWVVSLALFLLVPGTTQVQSAPEPASLSLSVPSPSVPSVPLPSASSVEDPVAEFSLAPENGSWHAFPPTELHVLVHNDSLGVDAEASQLFLNGDALPTDWDASEGRLWAPLDFQLPDGTHRVNAVVAFRMTEPRHLIWTFYVDTHVPMLGFDGVPEVTENRTLKIRGWVEEPNFLSLTLNGRPLSLNGGRFSAFLSIWPGPNDFVVEARDRAGNLGRAAHTVTWPADTPQVAFETWVHANASFAVDLPTNWHILEDDRTGLLNRTALLATAPLEPGVQTSLAVLARHAAFSYPRERALEWMDHILTAMEASGRISVLVSQPRLVELAPRTVAVQASFLDNVNGMRAFTQITMVWSPVLWMQWVLLASVAGTRAHEEWPLLHAAVGSFRPVDEDRVEGLRRLNLDLTLPVVTAVVGSVTLVTLMVLGLLEPRWRAWRKRRREVWRPPRSWRL